MHDGAVVATGNRIPYPAPELRDGVVRLRRWEHRDIECVRVAATDPRIPQGTTVPAVFSPAAASAFIERQWGRQTSGEGVSLAIEDDAAGTAVGLVVAVPGRSRRGRDRVLGRPACSRPAYAGRAVALLTPWLLDGTATRVEAFVEPDNVASRRTLEACGFRQDGVRAAYLDGERDVVVYSRSS